LSPLEKFYHWEKTTPEKIFLHQPVQGQWRDYSFQKTGDEIRRMASALRSSNLPAGSNIAILSKNCAHWIMADLAIWMAGHVSVPLYPNLTALSIGQILEHSEAKLIFVGKLDDYSVQKKGIPPSLRRISFSLYGISDGESWDELINQNKPISTDIDRDPDELVTIMYTSGTTGVPKGVMFNFRQLSWTADAAVRSLQEHLGFPFHARLFSYLPLSHIAERMITELTGITVGAHVTFAESIETFGRNLAETQPYLFFGVPRIYSKFQEKILEKIPQHKLDICLKIPILGSYIRNKIKENIGLSRARIIGVGAAPVPPDLVKWYSSLGITVRDIYGMTETCGFCTFNLADVKMGSVGQPWPGVDVVVSKSGEILTRHPGSMMGYFKEATMTADIFDQSGFVRTGDVGEFDEKRFLTITGRIKDIFKTDKGKYVAPGPIEMQLLANSDIDQVCVVGMGIPQPIALLIISIAGKKKSKEDLQASVEATLSDANRSLETHEQLETAVILKHDWSTENGLLTPTLKVKRKEVEKLFLPHYLKWYAEKDLVVWE
jgi:long-chain acyl-CoA synthetase